MQGNSQEYTHFKSKNSIRAVYFYAFFFFLSSFSIVFDERVRERKAHGKQVNVSLLRAIYLLLQDKEIFPILKGTTSDDDF